MAGRVWVLGCLSGLGHHVKEHHPQHHHLIYGEINSSSRSASSPRGLHREPGQLARISAISLATDGFQHIQKVQLKVG